MTGGLCDDGVCDNGIRDDGVCYGIGNREAVEAGFYIY